MTPLYQGMVIVHCLCEEAYINSYGATDRAHFEQYVQKGEDQCGRKILAHEWVDQPLDIEGLHKVARKLFDKILNPHIKDR